MKTRAMPRSFVPPKKSSTMKSQLTVHSPPGRICWKKRKRYPCWKNRSTKKNRRTQNSLNWLKQQSTLKKPKKDRKRKRPSDHVERSDSSKLNPHSEAL